MESSWAHYALRLRTILQLRLHVRIRDPNPKRIWHQLIKIQSALQHLLLSEYNTASIWRHCNGQVWNKKCAHGESQLCLRWVTHNMYWGLQIMLRPSVSGESYLWNRVWNNVCYSIRVCESVVLWSGTLAGHGTKYERSLCCKFHRRQPKLRKLQIWRNWLCICSRHSILRNFTNGWNHSVLSG